jgi:hypothetical protein
MLNGFDFIFYLDPDEIKTTKISLGRQDVLDFQDIKAFGRKASRRQAKENFTPPVP